MKAIRPRSIKQSATIAITNAAHSSAASRVFTARGLLASRLAVRWQPGVVAANQPAGRLLVITAGSSSRAWRVGERTSALSRPWRYSGEFAGALRSGRAGALAPSLALGHRLFEQKPQFTQYDSSATSDCSQTVYIALNGIAKNVIHVLVWRPEQDSNLRPTA